MDDVQRQMNNLGKGIVQANLRLNRVVELLEQGTPAAGSTGPAAPVLESGSSLELLFDLLDAVDRSLRSARAPVPAPGFWQGLFRISAPPPLDLQGLQLSREHVVSRLRLAGIEATPAEGPIDPRLHQVVDIRDPAGAHPSGTIAEVHRPGWFRMGESPVPIRLAQVTAWRNKEP